MSTNFFVRNTGILKRERPLGAKAERQCWLLKTGVSRLIHSCWLNRILKTKDFEVEKSLALDTEISDMVGLVGKLWNLQYKSIVKEALGKTLAVAKFFCVLHVANTYLCTFALS